MTINTKTGRLYIENRAASDIAEEFGTPCYVYSKNSIETNFNRFNMIKKNLTMKKLIR